MKQDLPLLSIIGKNTKNLEIDQIVTWDIGQEMPVRASGEFDLKGFYLDQDFDWVIGYDSYGQKILVALRPQEDENAGAGFSVKA